tara:strand:+ start:4689 stop:5909 length:1221 start_codon:yes stop_codon:yes gene_type:complete
MYLEYFDKFLNMSPYLNINEDEWAYIKETFDKDDVKESLAKIAMTYPIPYMDISLQDALRDFAKLKGVWWNDLLVQDKWYARTESDFKYSLEYLGEPIYFRRLNRGNDSSNYFQQKNRWAVDGSISPGPTRTWKTEKFMTTLMGAAYTLKVEKINKSVLRTMLGLRKYICSQFKPNVAKCVYDYFESKTILDFSAGWGDRLAGFYASNHGEHYVGIDPRKENHSIYNEQVEFYENNIGWFEASKMSEFICSPAEDIDYTKWANYFDLVFTSPPYFNVERYSYDDTQSWVRYKNVEGWNKYFLHRTLKKIWDSIKPGGYLLVNISDVNASSGSKKKGWLKICDPMNDFLSELDNSEYQGCIGMEMAKRPNSIGAGTGVVTEEPNRTPEMIKEFDGIFCEPIWVWKKN